MSKPKMHKYLLPVGFVVHIEGIPVGLIKETLVETGTELPTAIRQYDALKVKYYTQLQKVKESK